MASQFPWRTGSLFTGITVEIESNVTGIAIDAANRQRTLNITTVASISIAVVTLFDTTPHHAIATAGNHAVAQTVIAIIVIAVIADFARLNDPVTASGRGAIV
jgi:hypothetical protein